MAVKGPLAGPCRRFSLGDAGPLLGLLSGPFHRIEFVPTGPHHRLLLDLLPGSWALFWALDLNPGS